MAEFWVRSPALVTVGSAAEIPLWTLKTSSNRPVVIPSLRFAGLSVGVSDKPVNLRIRDYPNDGVDQTAITPVAIDTELTDSPRFVVNRQSAAPGGTEGPLRYNFWMFPQSIQGDELLHPTSRKPLVRLRPGRFFLFSVTFPSFVSGPFDFYAEAIADD